MNRAGLETMLMNYYRNIDREKIQFDFLTHRKEKGDYDAEIESLGGKIYHAPRLYPQNYPNYFSFMKRFFSQHSEYQIVHSHIDVMSYFPLKAAKNANIKFRIAHSHNTSVDKDAKYIMKQIFRRMVNSVATNRLACGEDAGKFLFFNEPFMVIHNAIVPNDFLFNLELRKKKRKEANLENNFVVGNIGRLSYQKNQNFLITIFSEIVKIESSAKLIIIGVGEKEKELKKMVDQLGLIEKVLFLGNRSDVNEWYQAMDVFVLPSFFEGIPVVGVEAQFASLPCFFSEGVPKEVQFSDSCYFLSLKNSPKKWAKDIVSVRGAQRNLNYKLLDSQYNIFNTVSVLEKFYLSLS